MVAIVGMAIGGFAVPVPANAAIAPPSPNLSSVIQAAGGDPVIAAAGDIACDPADSKFNGGQGVSGNCRQMATSNLMVGAGLSAVLALGDNTYYCGSYGAFTGSYNSSWGRLKAITHPSVGNHEYLTHGGSGASTGCDASNTNAAGYYQYFGAAAGDPTKGYYSFNVGSWHLIAINTQCSSVGGCSATSPQGKWLAADLDAHPNQCTLAYFHIPLFSSGGRASSNASGIWQVLYAHHADVILNGHDHIYERFAPQTPVGSLDAANGIREFIVGTGGANNTSLASIAANSEVRNASTFGVLALTLHPAGYNWNFLPEAGKSFTDSGSGTCHASGGGGGTAPTFTSANSVTFTAGSAGTFAATTTGSPLATITKTAGSLPSGVTFVNNGNGTATLAGTPPSGTSGTYPLTITATNGYLPNATQSFTLTVNSGAPTITSLNSATFAMGSPGAFNVTTTGSPIPGITQTGGLPTGVTFVDNHNGTATLAGTPAIGTNGTYPLTITAANGALPNASQSFTLTVSATAPTITSPNSATFTVGSAGTFTVTTTGSPVAAITKVGSLPGGVTFTDNHNGTGTLAGTAATRGTYPLTISAANGVAPNASQSFTLTTVGGGGGGTTTLTTIADAKVDASAPGTNYSTAALRVDGSPIVRSYIKFDASSLTGQFQGATLRIWATSAQSPGFDVYAVSDSTWTESGITYANQPAGSISPTKLGSSGTVASGTWKTIDVSALVTTPRVYSVVLQTTGSTALALSSREDAAHAPQLVITQASATIPDAPTNVSATAGNGQAQVSWTASLNNGGSSIIGYTVTRTPGGGTTPVGNVTTATVTGLINGTSYTFTVHATNVAGNGPESLPSTAVTPFSASSITSSTATTFTVGSPGTFTVTTSGWPVATISTASALPSGVTFANNGNGTATLSGTPASGTGGTYPLTITAANGVLPDATQNFTLTVNAAPSFTSLNSATFMRGGVGTFTVTTSGWPVAGISTASALPGGVTFADNGNGTATLSGTPTTTGIYPLTITASNGVVPNATQTFTLTVNAAPAITSAASATFTVDTAGSFTVTSSGFPAPTLSTASALPTGVSFVDNGDGTATLSGTPAAGTGGTYPLTITAANTTLPNAIQSFTLTVNEAPAITSASSATFTVGSPGSFTVTSTGFPTAAISTASALPTGVSLVDNGNGTAALSGTPASGTGGTYYFSITAVNGTLPNATKNFTLTVNAAPSVTSDPSTTFSEGVAGSFTVTSIGFPTVGITETGALPSGVQFVDIGNGTATLAGTPDPGTGGVYYLSITAANGVSPDATQGFWLTVDAAPIITSANNATFVEGDAGSSFTITTTGWPHAAFTVTGALPGTVAITDNLDGTATLAGTPTTPGDYPLTITAGNGILPDASQSFTLTVDAAPTITSADNATFTEGDAGSFAITTTGRPIGTISESGALPSGVTFFDNGDGTVTLSGTPDLGTNGPYSLTITATNGVLPDATQTFTLTVDAAPIAPGVPIPIIPALPLGGWAARRAARRKSGPSP